MSEDVKSPMVFEDLEPITFPITIGQQKYVGREADEGAAVKFQNARVAAARFNDGELDRVQGAADVEPLLVSLCVKKVGPSGELTPVSIEEVKAMPSRIVRSIYDRLLVISGLDDKKTIAQIDKEIARLTKKRAELVKEGGSPNAPGEGTTATSS